VETDICIAITVFDTDYEVVDYSHSRAISLEFLIGGLGIMFLSLDEQMIEVKVIFAILHQLACLK